MAVRAASGRRRRAWVLVHRYTGIALALWWLLLGITGVLLVYRDEIDALLNPHLLRTDETGRTLPVHEIVARARAALPGAAVERIRPPRAPGDVYRLLVRVRGDLRVGSPRAEAMVSPVGGTLLGVRDPDARGLDALHLMQTVYELHHRLLLGNAGKTAVGFAGIAMFGMLAVGCYLLIAHLRGGVRRSLAVRVGGSATRLAFDVHRLGGLAGAVLLTLSSATGVALAFPDYVRDVAGVFAPAPVIPPVPWRALGSREPQPLEAVLTVAQAQHPGAAITEVHLPVSRTDAVLVYLRAPNDAAELGDTLVWVDPVQLAVLRERTPETRSLGEAIVHWSMPLHSGYWVRAAGRLAMAFAGLLIPLLAVSGLYMWLRKRRGERTAAARRHGAMQ
jgi:uncharacterized iron-regulated membrane protein